MIKKDKNKLKLKAKSKILVLGLISVIFFGFLAPIHISFAATCEKPPTCTPPSVLTSDHCSCTYNLLAPLPCKVDSSGCDSSGKLVTYDPTKNNNISDYLNIMITLFIGICAVLSVIMIVAGGIEYMTSELISSKEAGRERIRNAILGLLLALGSWTLLNQINPNLLKTDLESLQAVEVTIDLGSEGTTPITATKEALTGVGINCAGGGTSALLATAKSFIGHSTYSMKQGERGTVSGGIAYVDCSSFVTEVYNCVGLGNPGGTTAGIFGSAISVADVIVTSDGKGGQTVSVDKRELRVGDLIGWKQGENGERNGHVMMYIGNGQMIDAQGGGAGVAVRPVSSYAGRIKYIKPI